MKELKKKKKKLNKERVIIHLEQIKNCSKKKYK